MRKALIKTTVVFAALAALAGCSSWMNDGGSSSDGPVAGSSSSSSM